MKHSRAARCGAMLLAAGTVCLAVVTAASTGDRPTAADALAATARMTDDGEERVPRPARGYIVAHGIVEPAGREARLGFAGSGIIDALYVREGDQVEAGAALARLNDDAEAAALRTAEVEVELADARLSRASAGATQEERAVAEANAVAAKERAHQASADAGALAELAAAGATPESVARDARSRWIIDAAQADASEAQRRSVDARPRREEVAVALAERRVAEARLEQARRALASRTLRAVAAGTVLQVRYRVGERFTPESPLLVFGDVHELQARVDVDERDVASLAVGQSGFLRLPGRGDTRVPVRVVEIGRRMGRKNVRSDDPVERVDTKIVEVVLAIDGSTPMISGLRVAAYLVRP